MGWSFFFIFALNYPPIFLSTTLSSSLLLALLCQSRQFRANIKPQQTLKHGIITALHQGHIELRKQAGIEIGSDFFCICNEN